MVNAERTVLYIIILPARSESHFIALAMGYDETAVGAEKMNKSAPISFLVKLKNSKAGTTAARGAIMSFMNVAENNKAGLAKRVSSSS